MRFLFTLQPLTGHFHSLAPVALALQAAGHEVAFATGARFTRRLAEMGFTAFACGLDFDGGQNGFALLPEWPSIVERIQHPALQQLASFVEGLAPRMADDLIPLVTRWKPDLIVRDPVEYGGYVAAEVYGLPHASVMWGIYIDARRGCADSLHALRSRYGLPRDPGLDTVDRDLVIKYLPPFWEQAGVPEPPSTRCFCAAPYDGADGGTVPQWVDALPPQPIVYATLGTTFNQSRETFAAIIAALADEPVNLILTVGRTMEPRQFDPLPPNVHVEQYIPNGLLLPRCRAVIFHGGFNTLHGSLWHGLPMVVTPLEAGDQWPTAMRCVEEGVGVWAQGSPPSAETIRTAVHTVLSEARYRQRAQALAEAMRELPPLSEAVRLLEALASANG